MLDTINELATSQNWDLIVIIVNVECSARAPIVEIDSVAIMNMMWCQIFAQINFFSQIHLFFLDPHTVLPAQFYYKITLDFLGFSQSVHDSSKQTTFLWHYAAIHLEAFFFCKFTCTLWCNWWWFGWRRRPGAVEEKQPPLRVNYFEYPQKHRRNASEMQVSPS